MSHKDFWECHFTAYQLYVLTGKYLAFNIIKKFMAQISHQKMIISNSDTCQFHKCIWLMVIQTWLVSTYRPKGYGSITYCLLRLLGVSVTFAYLVSPLSFNGGVVGGGALHNGNRESEHSTACALWIPLLAWLADQR